MRDLRDPPGLGRIYIATLVSNVGKGAWYSCVAVFATRSVGLSAAQFGAGLTLAGLVGLIAGSPLGYLADRFGIREMLVGVSAAQALAAAGYALVRGFWPFVAVTCVAVAAERAAPAIRVALISALSAGAQRLRAVSTSVVVAHVGMAAGAVAAAGVLYLDSRPGYLALILLTSAANAGFAAIVRGVPHVVSLRERAVTRRVLVLRDRPFLTITALSAVLSLNWGMLGTAVPLWITNHTGAPAWIIGVITAVNAVAIVLFQNRACRRGATVPAAARLAVYCALALGASCLLFAAAYHRSGAVVVALLLAAAGAHAVGELLYGASGWGLAVGLTPDDAHGEYQGMFNLGPAAALMLAPALMTVLVVGWAAAGWAVLAAVFLLGGLPTVSAARWALVHRPTPSRGDPRDVHVRTEPVLVRPAPAAAGD